jgi:hypothetical protein
MFSYSKKLLLKKNITNIKGLNFKLNPPIQSHENGKAKVVLVHEPGKIKIFI